MRQYLIALTLVAAGPVLAAEPDPFFAGSLFFTPFSEVDTGPNNKDGSGFGVRAEIGGALHIHGEYMQSSLDTNAADMDFSDSRVGLGYRSHLDNGYLQISAEYVLLDFDTAGDDEGVGVHIGGGFNASENVTLTGRMGMLSLKDLDGPELRLGISGKISDDGRLFAEYRTAMLSTAGVDVDVNDLRLGVIFSF